MHNIGRQHIKQLLTPSVLSAFIVIGATLILLAASVFISLGQSGKLHNELFAVNYVRHGLNTKYSLIASSLNSIHFLRQLPLWIFWAVVGVVAYLFAVNLFRALMEVNSLKNSMHYVHAKPGLIMKEQLEHFAVRIVSLFAIWLILSNFFRKVLPLALAVVRNLTLQLSVLNAVKLLAISILIVIIGHILTIFLRLAMLKPRVFVY